MDAKVEYEPRARRMPLPTRGGEMAFLDFGRQDRSVDIVFSHANGFNARTYRSVLAPLADELRILAVDMRGHGASTLPTSEDSWEGWGGYRDDLLAFLEAATDGPVALAGHSMGGTSSLLAAAAEPARVKALALFDPVLIGALRGASGAPIASDSPLVSGALRRRATFPDKAAALAAYLGRGAFKTWRPEQLADYVAAGFRETGTGEVELTCAPAWEAANFRNHNYDPWGALRDSRCPIHIARAAHGSTVSLDGHEAELVATDRITIETVPGTTHFLPMERPDRFREILRAAARV